MSGVTLRWHHTMHVSTGVCGQRVADHCDLAEVRMFRAGSGEGFQRRGSWGVGRGLASSLSVLFHLLCPWPAGVPSCLRDDPHPPLPIKDLSPPQRGLEGDTVLLLPSQLCSWGDCLLRVTMEGHSCHSRLGQGPRRRTPGEAESSVLAGTSWSGGGGEVVSSGLCRQEEAAHKKHIKIG